MGDISNNMMIWFMGLLEMKVEIAFCARENNDQPLDVGEPRNLVSDKPISGS